MCNIYLGSTVYVTSWRNMRICVNSRCSVRLFPRKVILISGTAQSNLFILTSYLLSTRGTPSVYYIAHGWSGLRSSVFPCCKAECSIWVVPWKGILLNPKTIIYLTLWRPFRLSLRTLHAICNHNFHWRNRNCGFYGKVRMVSVHRQVC